MRGHLTDPEFCDKLIAANKAWCAKQAGRQSSYIHDDTLDEYEVIYKRGLSRCGAGAYAKLRGLATRHEMRAAGERNQPGPDNQFVVFCTLRLREKLIPMVIVLELSGKCWFQVDPLAELCIGLIEGDRSVDDVEIKDGKDGDRFIEYESACRAFPEFSAELTEARRVLTEQRKQQVAAN